jgi:hypothetical protein
MTPCGVSDWKIKMFWIKSSFHPVNKSVLFYRTLPMVMTLLVSSGPVVNIAWMNFAYVKGDPLMSKSEGTLPLCNWIRKCQLQYHELVHDYRTTRLLGVTAQKTTISILMRTSSQEQESRHTLAKCESTVCSCFLIMGLPSVLKIYLRKKSGCYIWVHVSFSYRFSTLKVLEMILCDWYVNNRFLLAAFELCANILSFILNNFV